MLNNIVENPSDSRIRTILAFEAGDDMPVLLFLRQFECKVKKNQTSPANEL